MQGPGKSWNLLGLDADDSVRPQIDTFLQTNLFREKSLSHLLETITISFEDYFLKLVT